MSTTDQHTEERDAAARTPETRTPAADPTPAAATRAAGDGLPPRRPTASYRLQLQPGFGFAEARAAVPYLAGLGVSHLHLSPVLQAVPGSRHGYDVVDHTRISADHGGEPGLRALAAEARAHGLGLIADVVPNHMALPAPEHLNQPLWQVLRDGPDSPCAAWFDIDWAAQQGRVLLPVLGDRLGAVLERGELHREELDGEPVLRYFEHVLPVRPGTEHLPLAQLVDRQWYRPAWWRLARTELNYRRFFTVDSLIAVRVEQPEVFAATHELLLRLHREGVLDGFRIDHPDGLADPRGYLDRLHEATGGAYTVVEKILTGPEALPADWQCAGTTGYDALRRIDGVLTVPGGTDPLALAAARAGRAEMTAPEGELAAEVNRLARQALAAAEGETSWRDHAPWAVREALAQTLAAYPVYRPYPEPGEALTGEQAAEVARATAAAAAKLPAEHADTAADLVRELLLSRSHDALRARFAQTASAVAAKGVEDTAFYRHHPLLSLNEVGGDPAHPGLMPDQFHAYCRRMQRDRPLSMTALSTHDTKRSADARARLTVLAESPAQWLAEMASWSAHAPGGGLPQDRDAEHLLWQTVYAAWPISGDRLAAVVLKSVREAKQRTTWTEPDEEYERAVEALARAVPETPELVRRIEAFTARTGAAARANTLAAALLHLTMPGVPDLYQGSELPLYTLVDPDNRDIVPMPPQPPADATPEARQLAAEKLELTRTALRARAALPHPHPAYHPWPTPSRHLLAFVRGDTWSGEALLTAVTRLPHILTMDGGWRTLEWQLPPGQWQPLLPSAAAGPLHGTVRLAELLDPLPVALLRRTAPAPAGAEADADADAAGAGAVPDAPNSPAPQER